MIDFIADTQDAEQRSQLFSEPLAEPITETTSATGFSQVDSYAEEPICSSEESDDEDDSAYDAGWSWKHKLAVMMAMLLLGLAGWDYFPCW